MERMHLPDRQKILLRPPAQLLLIALAVVGAYYHTLDVPFYLDDFHVIRDNPLVYQWQGLAPLWRAEAFRIVGFLSFALNYQLGQFSPAGYHLLNIAIHFLAGVAVYGLTRGLLRTPRLSARPAVSDWLLLLPLLTALIFVLHPLQTQAVTYIAQRFASLAALFYLASLAAFVQARLAGGNAGRWGWGALCLLTALAALLTKQNTWTLPLALVLVELVFFRSDAKRVLPAAVAALAVLSGLGWLLLTFGFGWQNFSLEHLLRLTRETDQITRLDYLATQTEVLWHYIRLFFWPQGLHLDYDFPLRSGFLQFTVSAAALGHLLLLGLAFYGVRRWPLPAFAVLFYYLAHLVESSVLPIRDLVFEHRTYLPNFGLSLLVAWGALAAIPASARGRKYALLACLLVLVLLGTLTWQRNQLWRNPIALWQDNITKAPDEPRGRSGLGQHLLDLQRYSEALPVIAQAIRIQEERGDGVNAYDVINLVAAMINLQQYQKALDLIGRLEHQPMRRHQKAKLLAFRGVVLAHAQDYPQSEASFMEALRVFPPSIDARLNLATLFALQGRLDEAEALYREVLAVDPGNHSARANLQEIHRLRKQ